MSSIQKYVKKYYDGGITIDTSSLSPMEDFDASTFDFDANQMSNPADQFTGAQQIFQEHGTSFQDLGTMDKIGMGVGTAQELVGAFKNPYDDLQGQSKGDVLMQQGSSGVESALKSGNPLNLLKTGTDMLDTAMSDDDATTYTAKEIGADVAGVGVGVGRIMSGDVVGGVQQTASELIDIGKSVFGRKKAREEEIRENKKVLAEKGTAEGIAVGAGVLSNQQTRASEAFQGASAMQEKYKVAKHGARIKYNKGGMLEGSRPEDLKYSKEYNDLYKEHSVYTAEDYINKNFVYNTNYSKINKHFDKGGKPDDVPIVNGMPVHSLNDPRGAAIDTALTETQKQNDLKRAEELMSGVKSNPLRNSKLEKAINVSGDAAFAAGLATSATGVGGLPGGFMMSAGTAVSAIPEVSEIASRKTIMAADKLKSYLSKTQVGDFLGIDKDYRAADFSNYGGTGQNVDDLIELAAITPVGKSLKVPQKIMKATQKTNKYAGKTKTDSPIAKAGFVAGGMTQGEFSHEKNPLTVVDKNGQDTGMELTGGEGVFDQKAMTMLDKYKQNKNYSKAGKLVFQEMESWKAAGTAKYGTRIKYK